MAGSMGLRERALECFRAGIEAVDPGRAVKRHLVLEGGRPVLPREGADPGPWKEIHAVAFGKAACAMGAALRETFPGETRPRGGVLVTNHGNRRDVEGFEVHGAGHPLPDAAGVAGARAVAEVARRAREGELLLVLISGGGSAILPAPAEGISLEDKITTTDLLLSSGADIGELNTVRKHLSELKGGGLARLAAPASLHALILSDVIGDDLSTIASGPTVPDPTTHAGALAVLARRGILEKVPAPVRERLERGRDGLVPETPKPGDPIFARTGETLIGSNRHSLEAAREAATAHSPEARVVSAALCGEAREEAETMARAAREELRGAAGKPVALLAGGETTVTVRGKGRGGRNQEMALAFALAAERLELPGPWVFLSGGTDGLDGPTDAAGGVVNPGTLDRLRAAGIDPRAALDDNDSYRALQSAGDLLVTGPTGTNVADLQIFLAMG